MVVWEQLKHLINQKKKNFPLWILISSFDLNLYLYRRKKKKTCWFYSAQELLAEHVLDEKFFDPQLHTNICHSAFTFPPSYSNHTY